MEIKKSVNLAVLWLVRRTCNYCGDVCQGESKRVLKVYPMIQSSCISNLKQKAASIIIAKLKHFYFGASKWHVTPAWVNYNYLSLLQTLLLLLLIYCCYVFDVLLLWRVQWPSLYWIDPGFKIADGKNTKKHNHVTAKTQFSSFLDT